MVLQYDDAGRVQSLSMESAMEGDGSVISTTLHFTTAGGLPAADSAFATANGCMQVRTALRRAHTPQSRFWLTPFPTQVCDGNKPITGVEPVGLGTG